MAKKTGRNAQCPCGSGKKFKVCCGVARGGSTNDRGWRQRMWTGVAPVVTVLAIIGFFVYLGAASERASAGGSQRVWDAAHGHYHTVEGPAADLPSAAPPSAPPPGKVWNAEHGHWHDE